ncbi:MMPL family transporter [Stackebrandtia nassauensis]|uniref:MMPL domain protein n=1 Tax=Stackebrandtia nassauensis (strain DSM 44728 / CIP 108903 / NRRL B-16338 / NBRC 102104 / LLR-40K-21) TaxID=446470 RepID=D3PXC0_STANL|nr:MMPL family transporter [Stackebrandtia nassauensis]ADD41383.1 MMPL domain protein [Stackebrandtia nassauensis DSM 44728]
MSGNRVKATGVARWSIRHPWWAMGLWLAFVVAASVGGGMFQVQQAEPKEIAVGESREAIELLEQADFEEPPAEIVLITADSAWDDEDAAQAAKEVTERLDDLDEVKEVLPAIGSTETDALLLPITLSGDSDVADEKLDALRAEVDAVAKDYPQLRLETAGEFSLTADIMDMVNEDLGVAGMVSIPLTLGILLLAFGAFMAAGVPLLLALTAVGSATGLWAVASQVIPDNGSAQHLILLIGLAVGVDYSLFYLKREREERQNGASHVDAVAIASATSGRAVLVSGFAVLVSMAGLYLAGDAIFNALATASVLVVAVAVLGSITVLPAVLTKLGRAVDRPRVPLLWRLSNSGGSPKVWPRLLRPALRFPKTTLLLTLVAMAALAWPAMDLELKNSSLDDFPDDTVVAKTYDRVVDAFPEQGNSHQIVVRADADDAGAVRDALTELAADVRDDDLFSAENVVPPSTSDDDTVTKMNLAIPYSDSDPEAKESLDLLRDKLVPDALADVSGAKAVVGGAVAQSYDYVDHQWDKMPLVIGFVMLLTMVMMAVAFRSVVVAVVAALLNTLSALAAFGLLVLVFQKTWATELLDFKSSGAIISWIPLFLFVILFGLSMDYHVFVVSRIREAVAGGMGTKQAIEYGLSRTAGVVSSAAIVMVFVFAVFALLRMVEMKEMGIGLAAAILIDATVVRILLLPSIMALLGRANWWPSKLSRKRPVGDFDTAPAPLAAVERTPAASGFRH